MALRSGGIRTCERQADVTLPQLLNLTNGAKLWEFNAGAPLSASPAIANGRIVIGSQDGRLYCFG